MYAESRWDYLLFFNFSAWSATASAAMVTAAEDWSRQKCHCKLHPRLKPSSESRNDGHTTGFFPSDGNKPVGSNLEGTLAEVRDQWMMSFNQP